MPSAEQPLHSEPLGLSQPSYFLQFFRLPQFRSLRFDIQVAGGWLRIIGHRLRGVQHEGLARLPSQSRRGVRKKMPWGTTKSVGCDIDSEQEDSP